MCGFDALMYAVCRNPPPLAPSAVEGDCPSIGTAIATAAIAAIVAAICVARFIKCPLLLRCCRRLRLGKLSRIDRRVRANLRQFKVVASVEPGLRELERQLHTVHVA